MIKRLSKRFLGRICCILKADGIARKLDKRKGELTMADNFSYEILEELAVLSENAKGWRKELNLISWNGRPAKFDIRDWAPDHEKMGKGVTLSNEEFKALQDKLKEM